MSERKLFAHEIEERLDELLLLKLRQRSPEQAARLLEALPRGRQERVLHWVGVAAQGANELGWLLASQGAENAAELGDAFDSCACSRAMPGWPSPACSACSAASSPATSGATPPCTR